MNVQKAMDFFHASHFRYPQSHEEVMEMVTEANDIHLPELPEGQRYQYDPQSHQLMVEPITEDEQ